MILSIICLFVLYGYAITMDGGLAEPTCTSRFDYERKMLHQMVVQEIEQKEIKESISDISKIINTLKVTDADGIFRTRGGPCTRYLDFAVVQQKMVNQEPEITIQSYIECEAKAKALEDRLKKIEAKGLPEASGSTYIRWGRTECPENGTETVYKGFAGGARYDKAGAANYVCLPEEPIWGAYEDQEQSSGTIWGVEYELHSRNMMNFFGKSVLNHDVPCCVCRTKRPSTMMIPGRNICFDGWTLEYGGFLVSDHETHHASEFLCLDSKPEFLRNDSANKDGKLFYFVEARCGSLPCPPYVNGRELTCAVCSK